MPIIDQNRLKGNYGSSYVASLLSSECLVRPVAAETDVGVDLYCETLAEDRPFLHFWVQVKTGDQCVVSSDGESASCSFGVDHLHYWISQPVPVFAALVPTDWPVSKVPSVYIVDLVTQLLGGIPRGKASHTMHSEWRWHPGDRADVRHFLENVVPTSTARLLCRQGLVAPIPTARPRYELKMPYVPVTRFRDVISQQIRRTAANSILFMFASGEIGEETNEFRRTMAAVLEQYPEDPHWENFMARAISHHADNEFGIAEKLYMRARDFILKDEKVRDKPN